MTEPTEPTEPTVEPTGEPTVKPTEPTNADFKGTPAYQAMAKQLSDFKAKEAERTEADAAAKQAAEIAQLESEGKYKEALAKRDADLEAAKQTHRRELLQRDLKSELYKAKFENDMFIAGAIANYDAEKGDIATFVAELVADEANKAFMGQAAPTSLPAPGSPSVSGRKLTPDQIKQMQNSPDREVRLQAIAYREAQYASGEL